MTKRNATITMILAVILTILLEVISSFFLTYNIFIRIISIFLYFTMICFILMDLHYMKQGKLKRYHFLQVHKDICILVVMLMTFCFLGNLQSIKIYSIILHVILVIFFGYLASVFAKLADEDSEYKEYYKQR